MSAQPGSQELSERLRLAVELAREAGVHAARARQQAGVEYLEVTAKGPQDFVTRADREAEDLLRDGLLGAFPGDGFVGEETGGVAGSRPTWVVDPIDGTANFVRGLPHWGVSVALVAGGRTRLGVIYDAPRDMTYSAAEGQGAFRGNSTIQAAVSPDPSTALAILGTSRKTGIDGYLGLIRSLYAAGTEHRRFGSAALGLAYVAEGMADAYYEASLNCWDALAGLLIAREAGAIVRSPPLDDFLARPGPVLCGNAATVDVIRAALPPALCAVLAPNSGLDANAS